MSGNGHEGTFWGDDCVLYPDRGWVNRYGRKSKLSKCSLKIQLCPLHFNFTSRRKKTGNYCRILDEDTHGEVFRQKCIKNNKDGLMDEQRGEHMDRNITQNVH